MKKFSFSLQKLMDYREQILGIERTVLSDMNAALARLNAELASMLSERSERSERFNRDMAANGMTPDEIRTHKDYMRALDAAIKEKYSQIDLQQKAIEKQTERVREARMEISAMEKLKDKKIEEYNYLENKENELFIEEFVSNAKATGNTM